MCTKKFVLTYNWIELVLLTVYQQFKRKPGTTKFGRSSCPFLVWMEYVITLYLLQYVYYISVVYIFVKVESVVELCLEWINLRCYFDAISVVVSVFFLFFFENIICVNNNNLNINTFLAGRFQTTNCLKKNFW